MLGVSKRPLAKTLPWKSSFNGTRAPKDTYLVKMDFLNLDLASALKTSKIMLNFARKISNNATQKAEEIVPEMVKQVCKMVREITAAVEKMGEKAGKTIFDTATQATATFGKTIAIIAGAIGAIIIAAPGLIAIPALGIFGFNVSGPVAGK